jgi:hypothetical protein
MTFPPYKKKKYNIIFKKKPWFFFCLGILLLSGTVAEDAPTWMLLMLLNFLNLVLIRLR